MNIIKAIDKEFETKSVKEIADFPVSVLQSVSESYSTLLLTAFGVKAVRDLANLKYVR